MQVWQNYITDLGRAYPMFALTIQQVNDVSSDINALDLLPPAILANLMQVKNSCPVSQLTPRTLILWTGDGAQFRLTYPQSFDQALSDYLTQNLQVQAFEFVGETIKYGRLRRMLENVQP